jgi:uncharacterized cupredoxin-like copper-binding protein
MKHPRALSALIIGVALATAACGSGDAATSPTEAKAETIDVSMTDNEFTPSSFDVKAGQEVTFRFTNDGKVDHEAILGSEADQADHESQMMGSTENGDHGGDDGMHGMDHGGSDAEAVTVEPGKTGTLTTTFDDPGTVIVGCHEPGHYASGMKATITVT